MVHLCLGHYHCQRSAERGLLVHGHQRAGLRVYTNNSGLYTQTITGASGYDSGDSYFWLSNNAYLHPPVDLGGFSYNISGLGNLALVPNTANGNSNQSAVNFFMIQSSWPNTPNWFQTPSLSLSEADAPTGDVISSAVFSLTKSDTLDCSTYVAPTTKIWQFYYTQQASTNEYYICGSGQMTTWVANSNGGLLVIDVEGFRNFYVSSDAFFGSQFIMSTGLDGIAGPLEYATNDNYIYPSNSGTPSVVDSNGLLIVAAPTAYYTPNYGANFVELVSNGAQVYEFLSASITPGAGLTGSLYVWPYGASGVLACNTTNPPSPFPANVYFAFRYTITPYYTWDGYWSVCASGIMTTAGWSAQVYGGDVPSGTAYSVLGITGSRQFSSGGSTQTQTITGLLQPWDDSFSKPDASTTSNGNMIYPQAGGLDLGGVTYMLNTPPVYANGYNGDSNFVTIYNENYVSGSTLTSVFEQGTEDTQYGYNTESTISFAPVSSATATAPAALQCSSLTAPQQRSYAFYYTINSTTSSSNWQVCASGQMWTNYVGADGGQLVMEIRGSRYFNYPASTYYSAFLQLFSGMAAPLTYGNNDNLIYPNNATKLSPNGVLANTYAQTTQFATGPSPYTWINFASYASSNQVFEYGGPSSNIASNFQLTAYSSAGQNPTCRAPYTSSAVQTLYFSYQLSFSGGSVCASGAITALAAANSDQSYTAVWISGFRSYNYNGAWTNATITGLAPQSASTAGVLTGDQKVFIGSNSIVSSTGLFYMTDNLIYYAPNQLQGSGFIALQYSNNALTESGCQGCGATSSGITSSSGVVSSSPSAVTQCGSTSVAFGAGSEALSPTNGAGNTGNPVFPSSSSSSSSTGPANSGAGNTSNSGGGGGISNGAIAGAVVGSVVGAVILFIILALCVSRGVFGGSGKKAYTSDEAASSAGASGSSRFAPMEESRGNPNAEMEMSHVEQNGETEQTA